MNPQSLAIVLSNRLEPNGYVFPHIYIYICIFPLGCFPGRGPVWPSVVPTSALALFSPGLAWPGPGLLGPALGPWNHEAMGNTPLRG